MLKNVAPDQVRWHVRKPLMCLVLMRHTPREHLMPCCVPSCHLPAVHPRWCLGPPRPPESAARKVLGFNYARVSCHCLKVRWELQTEVDRSLNCCSSLFLDSSSSSSQSCCDKMQHSWSRFSKHLDTVHIFMTCDDAVGVRVLVFLVHGPQWGLVKELYLRMQK
jgi:hypothetical protein